MAEEEEMKKAFKGHQNNVCLIAVIPKVISPTLSTEDENQIVPQWAVVVMVVGLVSLLFVIIFGVTVVSSDKCG